MDLLPKSKAEFSQTEYWNAFFKNRGNKAFEWYGEYPQLCGFIHKYIRPKDQVLVVGCGNSKISADLYDVGYRNIINIDVSKVVIKQMKAMNVSRPELIFEEMDALNTTYSDNQFSVVLDKGTLDALMPDDKVETVERISKYFDEIDRIMRVGGRYVCISLLQDHVLSFLLDCFSKKGWMVRIHRCREAEENSGSQGAALVLPVFIVVCTKFKNNSQLVVEVGFTSDGSVNKVDAKEKVVTAVRELQEVAMVCSGLRKTHAPGQELTIDVFQPNTSIIKYKVVIVESKSTIKPVKFAAFIVPHGRENEYIYCSPEGRQEMMDSLSMDRLAIIHIPRGNDPVSLDKVKEDLSPLILDVAPLDCRKPIPFLSTSYEDDMGKEVTRGKSEFSGDYVVCDVETDGVILRKLLFLSNSNVTQSEARLKKVKARKGKKLVVDVGYLSCHHHVLMSVGVSTIVDKDTPANILLIGLGGGSLCGYLHKCFTNANIVAVDIDPAMVKISTEYFHLAVDNRMNLQVADGIEYMSQCHAKGEQFDVILFDVDNKDLSMGMSCPPKEFIEPSVLSTVKSLLSNSGIFLLNLVCRNNKLRREAHSRVKTAFPAPLSIRVPDELGEIVLCWKNLPSDPDNAVEEGVNRLISIIELNKLNKISGLEEITDQLKKL